MNDSYRFHIALCLSLHCNRPTVVVASTNYGVFFNGNTEEQAHRPPSSTKPAGGDILEVGLAMDNVGNMPMEALRQGSRQVRIVMTVCSTDYADLQR